MRRPEPRWESNRHDDGTITFLPAGTSLEGMVDVTLMSNWPYRTYAGMNDTRRYDCRKFYEQHLKEIQDGNS